MSHSCNNRAEVAQEVRWLQVEGRFDYLVHSETVVNPCMILSDTPPKINQSIKLTNTTKTSADTIEKNTGGYQYSRR